MGRNDVAKIETASVIQKKAIMIETAAAFMAKGFILPGGSVETRVTKEINPKLKPVICFRVIILFILQKYYL